jgi:hypothetical protein
MDPSVAPSGTVTVSWVDVAAVTVVGIKLNITTFSSAWVLKPLPSMVTVDPTLALEGENDRRASGRGSSSFSQFVKSNATPINAMAEQMNLNKLKSVNRSKVFDMTIGLFYRTKVTVRKRKDW